MIVEEENYLAHYGILRKSGRYPWGSGGNVPTRSRTFLDWVKEMMGQGLSEAEVAKGVGMTTTELRAAKSIAKSQLKQADIMTAQRLKDKGWANTKIGERMGVPESTVRNWLKPGAKDKADNLETIANMLRDEVESKKYIQVGTGVENHLGISKDKLATAVAMLKETDGMVVHNVQVPQLGTSNKTIIKVLAPKGTQYRDIASDLSQINLINQTSENGGRSFFAPKPPLNIDSKRIEVRYAEDGGADADGVIYVRPGAKDLSLGGSNYAQVRIAVDGSHYLKGMAVYKDDLPNGVDLVFNTNKSSTGNKLDAMKPQKLDDPSNPFGSMVRQLVETDEHGNFVRLTSAMNIVHEQGNWGEWSRSLSSQVLSKQSPKLAKELLEKRFLEKQKEFDEIMALTNPTVRRTLLESFAEDADKLGVNLKAAAMKGQATHVILPVNSLKDTEIYAPNYDDGTTVALIRYPHGGKFEIPELTVNNRHREAKRMLGNAPDAVGINSEVAKRLSGADFDGDTVLVIPNNGRRLKSEPALEGLKDFDPQRSYAAYDGMPTIDGGKYNATTRKVDYPSKGKNPNGKGREMGRVSNLITDMTIRGATPDELAQAVRHSMVVIDAEKHVLDYKQSAIRNGIPALMEKYQSKKTGGASTLISRAGAEMRVPKRKPTFKVDPATGKKIWIETGDKYANGTPVMQKSKKLAETDDAHTLSSKTVIESVYADHSNRMKAMANAARKEAVNTPPLKREPSAAKVYSNEVASLNGKLNVALMNAPRERQAQIIGNATLAAKKAANPDMDDAEIKKVKAMALQEARARVNAKKEPVDITDREWEAIQAGAISNHKLSEILKHTPTERIKELATPRKQTLMDASKKDRAEQMLAAGRTQAEVAQALGVSLTTLKTGLK